MAIRILVVDDEKEVRDVLFNALTKLGGFQVVLAESAEEALRRIEKEEFALALIDLKLPKMDGLQLITEIVNSNPGMLTVLMTGFATIDSALEALKRGASDYLRKPIDLQELIIRMNKALEERSRFVRIKEFADKLEQANQELQRLDQVKSDFIALTSHELRTPLTVMKSEVQLILQGRRGKINKAVSQSLSILEANVDRLIKMVKNLLDLTRIESGMIEMRVEELELKDLVDFILGLFKPQSDEKSIQLENEVSDDLPYLYADREKVETIMINVVGNAVKFTPEGGKACVSAKVVEGDGHTVAISVRDSGTGIPGDQLEQIFEKFHQVGKGASKAANGTGLGLSIAKGLVEAHHGRIWAESEVGRGSVFTFTLPTSKNGAKPATLPKADLLESETQVYPPTQKTAGSARG
jgi:signal transduction histidine kinase